MTATTIDLDRQRADDLRHSIGVLKSYPGEWQKHAVELLEAALARRSNAGEAAAPEPATDEQSRAEQVLRRLLAYRIAGVALYADDGQLHDASARPWIDFKNDSVDSIEAKLIERGKTAATQQAAREQQEPVARLACVKCHSTKIADRCNECGSTEFKLWADILAAPVAQQECQKAQTEAADRLNHAAMRVAMRDAGYPVRPEDYEAEAGTPTTAAERGERLHSPENWARMSQFLSDVVTAAGLLSHGKRDKALASRLGERAFEIRFALARPVGWIDQFGNVWPLGAYSFNGKPSFHDAHKRSWQPLYRFDAQPAAPTSGRESAAPAAQQNAKRLDVFIDWYLRDGKRSEIHPDGAIRITTREHILAWLDRAAMQKGAQDNG